MIARHAVVVALGVALSCSPSAERGDAPAAPAEEKSDVELLRERIAGNPRDGEAWNLLAELYDRAGLYQEEVDALKQLVALKPELAYAHFRMGTAYNRLGRYEEAVGSFQQAARHGPKQPMILNNLAFSYGRLGRTDEEIATLEKAVAMRPSYAIAHFNLGMALLKQDRRREALRQHAVLEGLDDHLAGQLRNEIDAQVEGAPRSAPRRVQGR